MLEIAANPIDQAESTTLENGLRVVSATMPNTQAVSYAVLINAGSRFEDSAQAGISHFIEHLVFKGTRRWPTPRAISEQIEGVGGVLNASTGKELVTYWCKVPAPRFAKGSSVISSLVTEHLIPAEDVDRERSVILEEIDMYYDDPHSMTDLLSERITYPDHPMGRDIIGSRETLKSIGRDDLLDFIAKQYEPHSTVVAVAGKPSHAEAVEMAEREFGTWASDRAPARREYSDGRVTGQALHVEERATEQANMLLTMPAPAQNDPDRFALSLLNAALGQGMSSRLFQRIREQMGLAYAVYAYWHPSSDQGHFGVYAGVSPDKAVSALEAIKSELGLALKGLAADELERAREFVRGRLILGTEDTRGVLAWIGRQTALYDRVLPLSEAVAQIDAVTSEDVVRVAGRVLDPANFRLAVLGPFADAGPFEAALRN